MGNSNSGRNAIHKTVEQCDVLRLRVDERFRLAGLGSGIRYSWSVAGKELASVRLVLVGDLLTICYQETVGALSRTVEQTVVLTSTECHFGGSRLWFRCPGCNRRTGSIYLFGRPFKCRLCFRLTYQSQRETAADRALSRAVKISRRLGGKADAFSYGPKPKGMQERTYHRLISELSDLGLGFYTGLAKQFSFGRYADFSSRRSVRHAARSSNRARAR